ncbi:MAG: hypothetical protein K2G70_00805, partial [Turicibacter sp.]|nr:hypothetical protein [Turicibacter sp.]
MTKASKLNSMICVIGAFVGIITAYLKLFSPNTFWSLSDIANCGGFWITSVCLIIYFSKIRLQAEINSILYLLFKFISYTR